MASFERVFIPAGRTPGSRSFSAEGPEVVEEVETTRVPPGGAKAAKG